MRRSCKFLENPMAIGGGFKKYFLSLAVLCVSIMFFVAPEGAQAADPVGKFSMLSGKVDILRGGQLPAVSANLNDPVYGKDVIRTKTDSKAEITFTDGTVLKIAQKTRIDISEYIAGSKGVVKLQRGKVEASVPPRTAEKINVAPGANRFEIQTPNAIAGVRGTDYIVYYDDGISGVLVKTGTVYVINPAAPGSVVEVTAGQMTTVSGSNPPAAPTPATQTDINNLEAASTAPPVIVSTDPDVPRPPDSPFPPPPPPPSAIPLVVEITNAPALTPTNSSDKNIIFTLNEMAGLVFKLNGAEVAPTVTSNPDGTYQAALTGVGEGSNTFEILGTSLINGSSASVSYSWTTDYTAPAIVSGPSGITKNTSATITLSGDTATYSYTGTVGGTPVSGSGTGSAINLTGLPQGAVSITITATDVAGNTSSLPYSGLTTDYTAPVFSGSPIAGPAGTITMPNNYSNTEPGTVTYSYRYSQNGGTTWTEWSSNPVLTGLIDGSYIVEYSATDQAGNTTTDSVSFTLTNYSFDGSATGTGSVLTSTSLSGGLAEISGPFSSGWQIDASGTYTGGPHVLGSPWSLVSGGVGFDSSDPANFAGYWLDKATGKFGSGSTMTGISDLTFLTTTTLGTGTGTVSGSYTGTTTGTWSTTEVGSNYTETQLAFGGSYGTAGFVHFDPVLGALLDDTYNANMSGLFGGTSALAFPGTAPVISLGEFSDPNNYPLWQADFSGSELCSGVSCGAAMYGRMGGIVTSGNVLKGLGIGIYVLPDHTAGIIYSTNLLGTAYPGIGMFELNGTLTTTTPMGTTSVLPADLGASLDSKHFEMSVAGDINGNIYGDTMQLIDIEGWNVWTIAGTGSFGATPSSTWKAVAGNIGYDSVDNISGYTLASFDGTGWTGGGEFSAGVTSKGINISLADGYADRSDGTGQIIGVNSGSTWQLIGGGSTTFTPLTSLAWIDGGFYIVPSEGVPYLDTSISSVNGLMGSTDAGKPYANLLGIGQVVNPVSSIWGANIQGFVPTAPGSTSLTGATSFAGFIGGIVRPDNSLTALSISLFILPDGHTGIMGTPFDTAAQTTGMNGTAYPGIGMWELSGAFQIIIGDTGSTFVTPDELLTAWSSRDTDYLHVSTGIHDVAGDIYGSLSNETVGLLDAKGGNELPWRIWNVVGSGWYDPATSNVLTGTWDSVSGKINQFIDGGGSTNTIGYGLINIGGNQWLPGGDFVADVSGKDIWIAPDGSSATRTDVFGALVGVYNNTSHTWQAVGGGYSVDTPLAFASAVGVSGGYEKGFMYVAPAETANGIDVFSDSVVPGYEVTGMSGLMGGTADLWTGNPSFFMIGQYSNPNDRTLWFMDMKSYDPLLNDIAVDPCLNNIGCLRPVVAGTSLSGVGLFGGMAGISLNNVLEGFGIALYVKPGGETGYIFTNDINGKFYPDLAMWEANGTWTVHPMGTTTTVTPADIYDGGPGLDPGDTMYGLVGGDISGGIILDPVSVTDQNEMWGIWKAVLGGNYTGSPSPSWTAHLGWADYSSCGTYCTYLDSVSIAYITGDSWANHMLSGTILDGDGRSLNRDKLIEFSGPLLGTYADPVSTIGTWEAVSVGSWTATPLKFVSTVESVLVTESGWDSDSYYSLFGGTESLWTATTSSPAGAAVPVVMMGEYKPFSLAPHIWNSDLDGYYYTISNNYIDVNNPYLTYDGGSYYGFLDGIDAPIPGSSVRNFRGLFYALYMDNNTYSHAGILKGSLSGSGYPDINLYEMDGSVAPVEMAASIGGDGIASDLIGNVQPPSSLDTYGAAVTGSISGTVTDYATMLSILDEPWGIYRTNLSGTATGSIPSNWEADIDYASTTTGNAYGGVISGTEWANNVLYGQFRGYYAKDGTTGIMVGETLGTFNPGTTTTWQAVQMGAWIDTVRFLAMEGCTGIPCVPTAANKAALEALNIPAYEVGRVSMSGSGNNLIVNMNNAIFFAASTVAKPTLWASGDVNGTYSAAPAIGTAVAISGGGLTANFTPQYWDTVSTSKWSATINSTGTNTVNGYNVSFNGAAAGTTTGSTSGTFTGTAAGYAK